MKPVTVSIGNDSAYYYPPTRTVSVNGIRWGELRYRRGSGWILQKTGDSVGHVFSNKESAVEHALSEWRWEYRRQ